MKHVNPLFRDKSKLKVIAKLLGYEQRWNQEADEDHVDVLLWSKDSKGNLIEWNPDISNGDCFDLCLRLDITISLDKTLNVATARYVAPNAANWPAFVNAPYENGDYLPVVRRIALSAAYELAKAFLRQQDPIKEHDTCTLHPTSG